MNITGPLLYYLVILPVSVLPFGVLHGISSTIYFIIFHVAGYRKKVVAQNLRNSFPAKSEAERTVIMKRFYRQLCDVLVEGLKIFTISEKSLRKHITCVNPEVIDKYHAQGKSVIVAVGHYNSWELMLTGINLFTKHDAVVIYQPLRNTYLDRKITAARGKLGTRMLPAKEVKQFFTTTKQLHATIFAIDQSPPKPTSCYWMKFMEQETAVLYGTEKYAKDYNLPVVYVRLNKLKRGRYSLEFFDVTDNPQATAYGEITEKATRLLEKDIHAHPEAWLWSHKRWKHTKGD